MTTEHVDGAAVGRWLEVGDEPWLRDLEVLGPVPGGVHLPAGDELVSTLRRLGFADADLETLVHAVPDPDRTPEVWWMLERCAYRVVRDVGRWTLGWGRGPWPELPAAAGTEGRCFWIWVFLSALPNIRRWHRERGIPDDVSWATLADLGRHVGRYRRRYGITGLEDLGWFSLHFQGALYALGRLQFELDWIPDDPRASEAGLRPGEPVLGVHIPESGPMTPEACDESFEWARRFFPTYFPEHRARIFTCHSWLLDDQLAEYLPATSNIMRFQRRFTLVPGGAERDDGIFMFVLHRPLAAIDQIQPRTTLERAIVDHVRSGRHWRTRTGWFEV